MPQNNSAFSSRSPAWAASGFRACRDTNATHDTTVTSLVRYPAMSPTAATMLMSNRPA